MSLLKIPDAARLLNVKPSTIYSYLEQGMPHIRFSPRCIRFEEKDLQAWVAQCRYAKTSGGDMKSNSAKGVGEFTAFALRTRPTPKPKSGKPNSGQKSSGLTNLEDYRNTAYIKE